jgi:hypothetical protein
MFRGDRTCLLSMAAGSPLGRAAHMGPSRLHPQLHRLPDGLLHTPQSSEPPGETLTSKERPELTGMSRLPTSLSGQEP